MMPPGLDAGGWATARAGPVHSSHASPLALSPASGHASLPLHALPERNLIGVAGELRTLIKVRISPGLAAASKTRQIDDASVCCASRHTCLSEDSPSQDMVPPACPDASSSMRGNGQGTHSSWSLAPRCDTVVHSKTWEEPMTGYVHEVRNSKLGGGRRNVCAFCHRAACGGQQSANHRSASAAPAA